jgi:hypothetical protein
MFFTFKAFRHDHFRKNLTNRLGGISLGTGPAERRARRAALLCINVVRGGRVTTGVRILVGA